MIPTPKWSPTLKVPSLNGITNPSTTREGEKEEPREQLPQVTSLVTFRISSLWTRSLLSRGRYFRGTKKREILKNSSWSIDSWRFLPCKNAFLDILVVFRLDLGQISFNLVENAFATRRLALVATRTLFSTIDHGRAQKSKFWTRKRRWPTPLGFSSFVFFFFSPFLFLLFFSFCWSDWPCTGLACV